MCQKTGTSRVRSSETYGWIEVPVATSRYAENPATAEAYFQYPLLRMAPVPPLQAMASFIQMVTPSSLFRR
jgi:hypothetical protein